MKLKRCLYSGDHPAGPTVGKDVQILKHGVNRYDPKLLPKLRQGFSERFSSALRDAVDEIQGQNDIKRTGNIGQATFDVIWSFLDPYRRWQYRRFEPPKPVLKLIEPNQGFDSLHSSLWPIYTLGRRMGLSDLGTYNEDSNLPSGRPSDHAVYPSFAFDLGIEPDTGFSNDVGRAFFHAATHDPRVEYVILGSRIWSVGRGLHNYLDGGHSNHVHVSGVR